MQTAPPRTPTRAEVSGRLRSLINEITAIPLDHITDKATVVDELQMQSVAFVELQVAIEDEYQIQIDPNLLMVLRVVLPCKLDRSLFHARSLRE